MSEPPKRFTIPSLSSIRAANDASNSSVIKSLPKSTPKLDTLNATAAKVRQTIPTSLPPPPPRPTGPPKNPYAKIARVTAPKPFPKKVQATSSPPVSPTGTTFSQTFASPDASHATTTKIPATAAHSTTVNVPTPLLSNPHVLHINPSQSPNPVLLHIKAVPYQFSAMIPDFIFGPTRCGLYLSLKFHVQNPRYIRGRLDELRTAFDLRVLLVLLDHRADETAPISTSTEQMVELNKLALVNNTTLILANSLEEAGRWIETFKIYENKDPASIIMKRAEEVNMKNPAENKKGKGRNIKGVAEQNIAQAVDVLTTIKSVSRTDAVTLIKEFDTVGACFRAGGGELALIGGMGGKKVKRVVNVMRKSWNVKGEGVKEKKMIEEAREKRELELLREEEMNIE